METLGLCLMALLLGCGAVMWGVYLIRGKKNVTWERFKAMEFIEKFGVVGYCVSEAMLIVFFFHAIYCLGGWRTVMLTLGFILTTVLSCYLMMYKIHMYLFEHGYGHDPPENLTEEKKKKVAWGWSIALAGLITVMLVFLSVLSTSEKGLGSMMILLGLISPCFFYLARRHIKKTNMEVRHGNPSNEH